MNLEILQQAALALPNIERAQLAEKLLASLGILSEVEARKLWLIKTQKPAEKIDQEPAEWVSAAEMEQRLLNLLQD
jgi:primosomal protein N''